MAKEKIDWWAQNIDIIPDEVKKDIHKYLISSVTIDAINALTSAEQEEAIDQMQIIANKLAIGSNDHKKYRYLAATILNLFISVFRDSDKIDTIIEWAFTIISTWSSNADSEISRVAANALGQVAEILTDLSISSSYTEDIFDALDGFAKDGVSYVQFEAADALGPIIDSFISAGQMDVYTDQFFGIISDWIDSEDSSVKGLTAEAMLAVVRNLANAGQLGDYADETFGIVNSMCGDSDIKVRVISIEILAPVLIDILQKDVYETRVNQILNMLNNLALDQNLVVRSKTIEALSLILSVLEALDNTDVIFTIIDIANFETIVNLDLHQHSDSDVKDYVIDEMPDKLADFDERIDENISVITDNLDSITGLLTIIGTESDDDTYKTKVAKRDSKNSLDKIIENWNYDMMKWSNDSFSVISQASTSYSESFCEDVLRTELASRGITEIVVEFAGQCLDAGYSFVISVEDDEIEMTEEQPSEDEDPLSDIVDGVDDVVDDVVDGLLGGLF